MIHTDAIAEINEKELKMKRIKGKKSCLFLQMKKYKKEYKKKGFYFYSIIESKK